MSRKTAACARYMHMPHKALAAYNTNSGFNPEAALNFAVKLDKTHVYTYIYNVFFCGVHFPITQVLTAKSASTFKERNNVKAMAAPMKKSLCTVLFLLFLILCFAGCGS